MLGRRNRVLNHRFFNLSSNQRSDDSVCSSNEHTIYNIEDCRVSYDPSLIDHCWGGVVIFLSQWMKPERPDDLTQSSVLGK